MKADTSSPAPDLSEGVIQSNLVRFLSESFGEPVDVSEFRRCSSGFSWMTFSLLARSPSRGAEELILQVGPQTGLLAPYSARPQALVLKALVQKAPGGSAVPVAELVAWSDDESALGAPFFVCRKVAGDAIVPWDQDRIPVPQRRSMAEQMMDILGALHSSDAAAQALGTLQPEVTVANAATAEVQAWIDKSTAWRTRSYPSLTWAGHWLLRNAPAAPRVVAVHGDFRLGNFLQQAGHITAMLDWELAHVGHPHEDLGWLLSAIYNKGSRELFGVMPRDEAMARYTARSGIAVDASSVHYFECLAMFKSIVITQAGGYSYMRRGFDDMRLLSMGAQMASMVRALDKLIGARP
ncbi:MAG: phosphotransferase family protein [Burkholderiales bacterium]